MNNVTDLSIYREKKQIENLSPIEKINYLLKKSQQRLAEIKSQLNTK